MLVAQLHLDMHVLRADGNVGVVRGWKVVSGTKVMYNLTVAQDHTFTVGDGQWVVHNTAGSSGGDCGGGSSSGDSGTVDGGKVYSANGDPALRATRRPAFGDMETRGVEVDGKTYKLSQHAYNSLFKSGRKDIMPDDITGALSSDPQLADPSSVSYTNPITGTTVFVNPDTSVITGIWPSDFQR